MLERLSICLANSTDLRKVLACSEAADAHGMNFWLSEAYHNRSSTVMMAAVACRTRRSGLGIGVMSPMVRHPYLIAMDAATLDELSGGRLILGLGAAEMGARKHGMDVAKSHPVELMRAAAETLNSMLAGGSVKARGPDGRTLEVKLGFKPVRERIPLYVGAMRPRMLRLGASSFDGILFNNPCPLRFVDYAMKEVREGEKQRELKTGLTVGAFVIFSVAESREAALDAAREYLPEYLPRAYPMTLRFAGATESEIAPIVKAAARSRKEALSLISDELVEKFAVAGTPSDCVRELRKFADAGVDEVIAKQVIGPNPIESIQMIAEQVAPKLVDRGS